MTEILTGYAPIGGAKLYYEVAGEGHPLVMVHAGIADRTMWDGQFAEFAKHYRTIGFDNRGYGKTEPVEGEFAIYEDIDGLLSLLNVGKTYLMGCSMGGGACIDFTLQYPHKVDALILVGSGPGGLTLDVPEAPQFAEYEQASKAGDWERVNELAIQVWFDGQGRTPDQMDAKQRAHVLEMNRQVLAYEQRGLGKRKAALDPSATQRLSELHLPVLIIYGDRDEAYIPAAADYMAQHIQGAKKVLMPNTAHLPNIERPNEFNRIVLDFLGSL